MLRKVLSVTTIIVALILLFLLVRTLVHTFTGKPKVTSTSPGNSISQTAQNNAAKAKNKTANDKPNNSPAPVAKPVPVATSTTTVGTATNPTSGTSTSSSSSTKLSNTGPGETAMIVLASSASVGTMYLVRRKQIASL